MNPKNILSKDFFDQPNEIKKKFSQLIKAKDYQNCSISTAVSYTTSILKNNIKDEIRKENNIIVLEEQFPSDFLVWHKLQQEKGCELKIVPYEKNTNLIGRKWNERILESIDKNTKMVSIPNVHWSYGTKFDLKSIGKRCKEVGAYFFVDGTQRYYLFIKKYWATRY
jgi:selenocysteine lyase/cysteine desulfurase